MCVSSHNCHLDVERFQLTLNRFCCHVSKFELLEGLQTLYVYCKNLYESPETLRYHVISAVNSNFQNRIGRLPHSHTLLSLIGYEKVGPQYQLNAKYENSASHPSLKNRCNAFLKIISRHCEELNAQAKKQVRLPSPEHVYSVIFNAGVASRQGRRPSMEDAECIFDQFCGAPSMVYLGLYDGHGGPDTVSQVVSYLHENINLALLKLGALPPNIVAAWKETLGENASQGGIPVDNNCLYPTINAMSGLSVPEPADASFPGFFKEAFRVGYLEMDSQLRRSNYNRSGSTSVSVIIRKNPSNNRRFLHVANVGDSRAVLCRSGLSYRLTVDHKATLPSEQARVIRAGGSITASQRVNGVLAITRALGDHMLKDNDVVTAVPYSETIEIFAHPQQQSGGTPCVGDFFLLLACDGIWDVLTDQIAINHVCLFLKKYASHVDSLRLIANAEKKRFSVSAYNHQIYTALVENEFTAIAKKHLAMSASEYPSCPAEETSQYILERANHETCIPSTFTTESAEALRDVLRALPPTDLNFLLEMASESLVAVAYQLNSSDNLTAIVALL